MKAHRHDAGFSLAALIFFLTVASIFIAAAVPAYQMQAKREQEEELIFRGGEYTRAIQKYQRKLGAYPTSVDQLVSTNTLRFLRKPYKDPITGKDFRLIRLNPDGSLSGSKLFKQNVNTQSLFGNTQTFGGQNNPQQQQQQQQQGFGQPGQQPQQPGGTGFNQQPLQQNQFQQQPQQPGGAPGGGGFSQQPQSPGGMGFGQPVSTFGGSSGTGQQIGGGPIIGVASDSDEKSIRIYNNYQKYDEWEFIAIQNQQNQQNRPGNTIQPGNPGQPGVPQNNPFGPQQMPTPQSSPFGGPPTGTSPFGPGAQPTQPTLPQPGK